MEISFSKYQGTGNDFIILDNRSGAYNNLSRKQIEFLCHRRFGIGADGLMMLNNAKGYDFEMKYYNADGAAGSMCGNGGRCIAAFAFANGVVGRECTFIAYDGPHSARIAEGMVSLKMNPVKEMIHVGTDFFLDTGSPHFISFCNAVDTVDIVQQGRKVRYSAEYKAQGVNVNFVEKTGTNEIRVRTYERGVEDETYSCGTGVTAAAIAFAAANAGGQAVDVKTRGGDLCVTFQKTAHGYDNIWLTGPADFVFSGKIELQ